MAQGNIREYENAIDGLTTSGAAANAFEGAARTQAIAGSTVGNALGGGVRALGNSAQVVYDERAAQPEISKGGPTLAALNDNLNTTLQDLEKGTDPNDDSFVSKFREENLEPELEKFIGGFQTDKGRLWAEAQADRLRQHYYERTAADAATRAQSAVSQNIEVMTNLFGASAVDPHSLDLALGTLDDTIHEMVANSALTGTAAAAAETTILQNSRAQIVATGLSNMAQANPQAFLAALEAGEFDGYKGDLAGGQREAVQNGAKALVASKESDDKALVAARIKLEDDQADATQVDLMTRAMAGDPTVMTEIATQYAALPGVQRNPEKLRTLYNAVKTMRDDVDAGYTPPGTPEVFNDLMSRATLPSADPNRLTNTELQLAVAARAINKNQFDQINPVLNATDEGVKFDMQYLDTEIDKTWGPLITRSVSDQYSDRAVVPPGVSVALAQFRFDMTQRFNYGRSQGISAAELLDPSSSKSIFGRNGVNVQPYIQMAQSWTPGTTPVLTPVPNNLLGTPIQPGDSPEVILSREGVETTTVPGSDKVSRTEPVTVTAPAGSASAAFAKAGTTEAISTTPNLSDYASFFSSVAPPAQLQSINDKAAQILGGK